MSWLPRGIWNSPARRCPGCGRSEAGAHKLSRFQNKWEARSCLPQQHVQSLGQEATCCLHPVAPEPAAGAAPSAQKVSMAKPPGDAGPALRTLTALSASRRTFASPWLSWPTSALGPPAASWPGCGCGGPCPPQKSLPQGPVQGGLAEPDTNARAGTGGPPESRTQEGAARSWPSSVSREAGPRRVRAVL